MAKAEVCVCVCVGVYGTYLDNLDGDVSELSNAFNIFGNSFWIVIIFIPYW
jgi:hypothetical protein